MGKKILKTYYCLIEEIDGDKVYSIAEESDTKKRFTLVLDIKEFPRAPLQDEEFCYYIERSPQGFTRDRVAMYNPPLWTAREAKRAHRAAEKLYSDVFDRMDEVGL